MKLSTYLMFNGHCEEALGFYAEIFDAELTTLMRFSEAPPEMQAPEHMADKVMHATLEFSGNTLMASDTIQNDLKAGNNYHLSLNISGEEEAAGVFKKLSEKGEVTMDFESVFWGGKFGMLVDRFGIQWMVSSE